MKYQNDDGGGGASRSKGKLTSKVNEWKAERGINISFDDDAF